jgi:penicillin-binding protein 2
MLDPIRLKDYENENNLVKKRLVFCSMLVLFLSMILVCRLYYLQVTQHSYNSTVSYNNRVHVLPIPPERGTIYDRNGVVLAGNRSSFNLTLTRERGTDIPK